MGDRIYSISHDGNSIFEDEIILMMHNEPNQTALFYTFKTKQGYEVSLTATHNIIVYIPEENRIDYLRASKVTLKHHLITFGQQLQIASISMNLCRGFYAPLTLSSYLFVNNVSTSVFSESYRLHSYDLHYIFTPIRAYYHIMRWIYGKDYKPFETNVEVGLHPLLVSLKYHQNMFRTIYFGTLYTVPRLLIDFILYQVHNFIFNSLYRQRKLLKTQLAI